MVDQTKLMAWALEARDLALAWIEQNVLVLSNVQQVGVILLALFGAYLFSARVARFAVSRAEAPGRRRLALKLMGTLNTLRISLVWLLFLWLSLAIARQAGWSSHIIQIVASLASAWVIIRFASSFIRDPIWGRFIAITAWSLAALSTLGLFESAVGLLDGLAINVGSTRLSVLMVVNGVFALGILLWAAFATSSVLEQRIRRVSNLTPSVQVLFGKLTKIVLISLAILVALNLVGIDLTALTVFGGALGVGIGFGLQRIIANLISGVILLMDRSIKPGDIIAVGETVGWIDSLGARYASVRTRDGVEHLIPNEELIVQRVENWSHSDLAVRLKIPVGVSYKSDVPLAMALCVESAAQVKRVLKDPETKCLLKAFGESSVDLELRIWIDDPANGRSNVISEVLLIIWEQFHANGIEIPFPQRDVHLKTPLDFPLSPSEGGA